MMMTGSSGRRRRRIVGLKVGAASHWTLALTLGLGSQSAVAIPATSNRASIKGATI